MTQTVTVSFDTLQGELDPQLAEFFAPEETLTYALRVPTTEPAGLLIYISPKAGASVPDGWDTLLDAHTLVWAGAQDSGNDVHVARRVAMALLAPVVVARHMDVDPRRVLLSGFSGGGRVASMMVAAYPERFSGALFICGANPLFAVTPEAVDSLQAKPLVFLTGAGDFNLSDTRVAHSTFRQAGFAQADLVELDDLDHALPTAAQLAPVLQRLCAGVSDEGPER